jgi:LAO/AO transport system kinase
MSRTRLSAADYCEGVLSGDRRIVAKTITLLESRRPDHVQLGQQVLERLVPDSGASVRIGVSGAPGVGKSSMIETLGIELIDQGHRVAVLAVDPSSPLTGGSILGDKTRMTRLSQEENAFIRPSPSGLTPGGVAHRTREALLVCEAAGFGVVIVETVGVGQAETEVASMVDSFAVLLQPGAGDELQGIKRGVLELVDVLVVNKADGEHKAEAERTRASFAGALELLRSRQEHWTPRVLSASALTGDGVLELWEMILGHRQVMMKSGEFDARRRSQARAWLWRLVREGLDASFRTDPAVAREIEQMEAQVEESACTAPAAARILLERFRQGSTRV